MAGQARILAVNLAATLALIEALAPRKVLLSSSGGHYLGTALHAAIGRVNSPAARLCDHQAASQLFVRREAAAFGWAGARIVPVSPGIIDTPMGRIEMANEAAVPGIVAGGALPRLGRPEEVADLVAFRCSFAASFITSCDIPTTAARSRLFRRR